VITPRPHHPRVSRASMPCYNNLRICRCRVLTQVPAASVLDPLSVFTVTSAQGPVREDHQPRPPDIPRTGRGYVRLPPCPPSSRAGASAEGDAAAVHREHRRHGHPACLPRAARGDHHANRPGRQPRTEGERRPGRLSRFGARAAEEPRSPLTRPASRNAFPSSSATLTRAGLVQHPAFPFAAS